MARCPPRGSLIFTRYLRIKIDFPLQINHCEYSIIRQISPKEKRKANGNLTRRPPERLIALYKVFKVSVKPFQRLGGVRGGSPGEKALAGYGATAPEKKPLPGTGLQPREKQHHTVICLARRAAVTLTAQSVVSSKSRPGVLVKAITHPIASPSGKIGAKH